MRFTLLRIRQANIQLSLNSPNNWKMWPRSMLSQDRSHWSNKRGKFR